jgi:hypothetical protein
VGIVAFFILAAFVVKKLLERSEGRHMAAPGDGDATTTDDPL